MRILSQKSRLKRIFKKKTLSASKEIEKFKLIFEKKINIISEEIVSDIIKDIFKEDLNKSSIKATVSEVMKERRD